VSLRPARAVPPFGRVKICVTCRTEARDEHKRVPCWRCRVCGVQCCQHLCSEKGAEPVKTDAEGAAICGPCKRARTA